MLYPARVSDSEHIQSQETPKLSTSTLLHILTHCSMLTKRMEMRKNEMWRRMALTLFLCALLFSTCRGQIFSTETGRADTANVTTESINTTMSSTGTTAPTTPSTTHSPVTNSSDNQADPSGSTTMHLTTSTTGSQTQKQADTTTISDGSSHKSTSQASQAGESTNETIGIENRSANNNKNEFNKEEIATESESEAGSARQDSGERSTAKPAGQKPEQAPVFVPLLVSGLILAAGLIGLYVWKNHHRTKTTGMKLAEESYMADEDNQGNTLVSVAPLNPPESQDKPSQNGESLEAVKPQNPPAATNGHSTTKADTEL